jgi:hypothetical protein
MLYNKVVRNFTEGEETGLSNIIQLNNEKHHLEAEKNSLHCVYPIA